LPLGWKLTTNSIVNRMGTLEKGGKRVVGFGEKNTGFLLYPE
jgi:hypothetical protein